MSPTAEATKTTFRSRDQSLRLVKERTKTRVDDKGERVEVPDVTIEFRNVGGRGEYVPGDDAQFRDDQKGASETAKWLREHRLFNTDFFEVGNEPDRPTVEPSEVIAGIVNATQKKDADKVRDLVKLEYASYSRPVVIDAGKAALKALGEDPEEGTKPAPDQPVKVTQDQIEEIAKALQARLADSGDLTKLPEGNSDPNPDVAKGRRGSSEGSEG